MFCTPTISERMVWHAKNTSTDGLVRHPCDSKAWKHVHENVDSSFGREDRNIHLGLAADGVSPFKLQRTTWSTWPVMLLNYNIPPWLTTNKIFVMLALLILGKQFVTLQFFDVHLEPLVEKLMQLWKGVAAITCSKSWDQGFSNLEQFCYGPSTIFSVMGELQVLHIKAMRRVLYVGHISKVNIMLNLERKPIQTQGGG